MGVEKFGVFSFVQVFVSFFFPLISLGMDTVLVKELITNNKRIDLFLSNAFYLKLSSSVISIIFIFLILHYLGDQEGKSFLISILAFKLFFDCFLVIDFYFQSISKSKLFVISRTIALSIGIFLKIYFILNGFDIYFFVSALLIESVLLSALLVIFFLFEKKDFKFTYFSKHTSKSLLKKSWPMLFSSFVILIYMKIDQIMLNYLANDYELGIYSFAVKLSESIYFIPAIICVSFFPAIAKLRSLDNQKYIKSVQTLFDSMFLTALILIFLIIFFFESFLLFLGLEQYQNSLSILYIHIWAGIMVFFGIARHRYIVLENLQKFEILLDMFAGILNVFLNLLFIPKYGAQGAAFATLISYFGGSILPMIFIRKFRHIFLMFIISLLSPFKYFYRIVYVWNRRNS